VNFLSNRFFDIYKQTVLPEEDRLGKPPVAILSNGAWVPLFNSDPANGFYGSDPTCRPSEHGSLQYGIRSFRF
jgi:hypothetical protein